MALIVSPWKVTVGTLVILAQDEVTDGEIVPPSFQAVYQPANYLRASFSDVIPRALVSHTFSFARVKELGSIAEARLFALAHVAAIPKTPLDCKIEGEYGDIWLLRRARIEQYQPVIDARTFRASYSITGTSWAIIQQPTRPVPGLSPTADSSTVTADQEQFTVDLDAHI